MAKVGPVLLTREEMRVLLLRVTEVVGRLGIAAKVCQRLDQLRRAAELEHPRVLGVFAVVLRLAVLVNLAEDGGHVPEGQQLHIVGRDDAVLLKLVAAVHLEVEGNTEILDLVAGEQVAVALSQVLVVGPVKLPPVEAQHGSDLDNVADGAGGVRLLDRVGHGVPAPQLGLQGDDGRVRLPAGDGLRELGVGPGSNDILLQRLGRPLLALVLHLLDRLQQDGPGGAFVVGGVHACVDFGLAVQLLNLLLLGI